MKLYYLSFIIAVTLIINVNAIAQCNGTYIFKDKKDYTSIALEQGMLSDDGSSRIPLNFNFTIQSDWYIQSNDIVNDTIYAKFLLNPPDDNQPIQIAVPLNILQCVNHLPAEQLNAFYKGSLYKMQNLMANDQIISDEMTSIRRPFKKETLDFFNNNFSFSARHLLSDPNIILDQKDVAGFINILNSGLYSDEDQRDNLMTSLFIAYPDLFYTSFKNSDDELKDIIRRSLIDHFPTFVENPSTMPHNSLMSRLYSHFNIFGNDFQKSLINKTYKHFFDRMQIDMPAESGQKDYLKIKTE